MKKIIIALALIAFAGTATAELKFDMFNPYHDIVMLPNGQRVVVDWGKDFQDDCPRLMREADEQNKMRNHVNSNMLWTDNNDFHKWND